MGSMRRIATIRGRVKMSVRTIIRHVRIWGAMVAVSFSRIMHYRLDTVARFIGILPVLIMRVIVLTLPYQFVSTIAGWDAHEVLMVLGMFYVSEGLSWVFYKRGISLLEERLQTGMMSSVLLKPVNSRFFISFSELDVTRIADVVAGAGLLTVAVVSSGINVGLMEIVFAAVGLFEGLAIMYGLYLLVNSLSFWTNRTYLGHVANPVFTLARYPVDFWGGSVKNLFYFVVPLAFVSTVPAGLLAGKLPLWWLGVGVVMAFLGVVASSVVWRYGVRYYLDNGVRYE